MTELNTSHKWIELERKRAVTVGGESSATSIELGSLSRKASYAGAVLHH
jgi:hypothetical protein